MIFGNFPVAKTAWGKRWGKQFEGPEGRGIFAHMGRSFTLDENHKARPTRA